ncbi:hypothetical protein ETD83_23550 [Actinomadura soli]|uniref:DUF6199 domain-containing protein n=1 Tax=Actinomadura soli TaxID=2508997 RepID=A0A5C4J7L5_9ACTN|nr:hypothetical protein [Actinomadura soli]TMQ94735.1 hypothetical protein ETD83_23550 [Actinomadura soli]
MTALIVFMLVMAAVMFVFGCVDQRRLYWKADAWQYRNPGANEPSDAALGVRRASFFIGAVVLLAGAGILKAADASAVYSTADVHSVAQAAASKLDRDSTSGIGSSFSATSGIYDAVNEEGNGNVEIRSAGGDKYELTNRKGRNPVCLTVSVENDLDLGGDEPWSHSVTTSVDDGRC